VRQKLKLLALLLLARVASGEERLLSLPEALRLAAQGPALQAAAAARQAAAYRVDEVKSLRWPQLELQGQARSLTKDPGFLVPRGSFGNPVTLPLVTGERDVQTLQLSASYLLWDWGRTSLGVEAARKGEEAAAAQEGLAKRKALQATLAAFAQAQRAQGELAAAQQAVAAAQETLRVVTAFVEQQLLPDSDRLAAEFFLARRQAEEAAARAQLAAALAYLAELTGVSAQGVKPGPMPAAVEAEDAPEKREELQIAKAQAGAAQALAQAFRKENLPVLVLAGGVENIRDHFLLHQTNSYGLIALRASLFDGGKGKAAARQQEAWAQASLAQLEAARRQVSREVAVAKAQVQAWAEQREAAQKAVTAAQEELRLEQLRHSQGLTTTRDLLSAQEHLAQAQAAVAMAEAGYLQALGELASAAGEDLVRFFGGEQ